MVLPLECSYTARSTAIEAKHSNEYTYGATIRHGLNEIFVEGQTLRLRTERHGEFITDAKITERIDTKLWKALDCVRLYDANYSTKYNGQVLNSLRGYYDVEINPMSDVTVLIYKPIDE